MSRPLMFGSKCIHIASGQKMAHFAVSKCSH
jgi:hypothetical protein